MSSNTSVRPQKAVGEILDENAEENQCAVKHTEENTFAVIGNKSDLALFGVSYIKHTLQVYRERVGSVVIILCVFPLATAAAGSSHESLLRSQGRSHWAGNHREANSWSSSLQDTDAFAYFSFYYCSFTIHILHLQLHNYTIIRVQQKQLFFIMVAKLHSSIFWTKYLPMQKSSPWSQGVAMQLLERFG